MASRLNTLATLGEPIPSEAVAELPPLYQQQFAPPQLPPGFLDVQTYLPQGAPRVSGGVTLPFLGNELQVRGSFQRDPYMPDYSLMLGMRRQF